MQLRRGRGRRGDPRSGVGRRSGRERPGAAAAPRTPGTIARPRRSPERGRPPTWRKRPGHPGHAGGPGDGPVDPAQADPDRVPEPVPAGGRSGSCSSTSASCPTAGGGRLRDRPATWPRRSGRWSSAAHRRSARSPRLGLALSAASGRGRAASPATRRAMLRRRPRRPSVNARPTAVNLALGRGPHAGPLRSARRAARRSGRTVADGLREEAEAIMRRGDGATTPSWPARRWRCSCRNPRIGRSALLTHCNTGPLACGQFGTALGVVQAAGHGRTGGPRLCRRDAPLAPGGPADGVGAGPGGHPVHAPRGRCGRLAPRLRRGGRGPRRGGPGRRERRHRQQGGHVPAGGARGAPRGALLRRAPRTATLDGDAVDGAAIKVEMRGAAEVTSLGGKRIAPAGAAACNPSFDVTPAELITAIVTEAGVLRAPYGPARRGRAIEAREARRPGTAAGAADATRGSARGSVKADVAHLGRVRRGGPRPVTVRSTTDRGSCAPSSSATACSPPTPSATSTTASSPGPAGASRSPATSRSRSSSSTPATRRSRCSRWGENAGIAADPPRRRPSPGRLRRRAAGAASRPWRPLPRGARAPDGPDVGRPGHLPAVPGRGRPAPAGGDRRPQPALPAGLHGLAAADRDRRGRLLRDPRGRPPGVRGRDARRLARGPPGRRGQRDDPRRLPGARLRDRGHRRGHRRAAPVLRPGRAQRPRRQSTRRSRPTAGWATASTCASRSGSSTARLPAAAWPGCSRPRFDGSSAAAPALGHNRQTRRPPAPDIPERPPPMTNPTALPPHDVTDLGLADEGVRRIEWAEREMPVLRLIRERFDARAAAGRPAHRRLPPRHDRDREPGADAGGRRCAGGAGGQQPALDEGRRRRGAHGALRDRRLRPARRGPRHVLRAPQRDRRHEAPDHDGRRLRPRRASSTTTRTELLPGRPRRDRGDDDGRHPAPGDGQGRRPAVPGRRRQRGGDEAPLRQPLRDRPEHARRDPAGDEHPDRRPAASSSPATAGWARGSRPG